MCKTGPVTTVWDIHFNIKINLEGKEPRVNMGKTKVLISDPGLDALQKSGKYPCGICIKCVHRNSIFSGGCSSLIHRICGGIPGRLKFDASPRCKRCTGQVRPIHGRLMTEVIVGREKLEVLPSFCYLRLLINRWRLWTRYYHKMLFHKGQIQWALARPHLPLISHHRQKKVYNSCVRRAVLHASKTWAPALSDLHRLQCNNRDMICWMCGVTTKDQVSSQDLLERMQLNDLAKVLHTCRLTWHGHVQCSDGWLKKAEKLNPKGGHGHPSCSEP